MNFYWRYYVCIMLFIMGVWMAVGVFLLLTSLLFHHGEKTWSKEWRRIAMWNMSLIFILTLFASYCSYDMFDMYDLFDQNLKRWVIFLTCLWVVLGGFMCTTILLLPHDENHSLSRQKRSTILNLNMALAVLLSISVFYCSYDMFHIKFISMKRELGRDKRLNISQCHCSLKKGVCKRSSSTM